MLLTRCAREVTIELPQQERRVVAVGNFTQGEHFRVSLSFSQPVDDASASEVPDKAEVSIAANGQFYDRLFKELSSDGEVVWEGNDLALPQVPYSLRVSVPGYPALEASTQIPVHIGLERIPLSADDFQEQTLSDGRKALIVPLELRLASGLPSKPFFAFNLTHETEVFEMVEGQAVPDYSYETATFFLTDGPTLSLLHNISEPVVLVNEKYWTEDRRTLRINAFMPYKPDSEKPTRIFVEWRTLSEEFYRYHLSVARQGSNLPLNDPDAVFNNVKGGYGNFSAYSVHMDTLVLPR
ncbi:MAG TPA: DUF4249 family protein [Saprospiraceae bacterium]|nr:DUF4249 family protein [Saprospiraceae bacterium]